MTRRVEYRDMTGEELEMARALDPSSVKYLPGGFEKRFGTTMAIAADSDGRITDRQAALLRAMVWRFRRQLPDAIRALVPAKPSLHDTAQFTAIVGSVVQQPEYRNVNEPPCAPVDDAQGTLFAERSVS